MCIFYQDELGKCCINGLNWEDWSATPKCIEDRYDIDEPPVCPDKITVKDVKDMKQKADIWDEFYAIARKPESMDEIMEFIIENIPQDEH